MRSLYVLPSRNSKAIHVTSTIHYFVVNVLNSSETETCELNRTLRILFAQSMFPLRYSKKLRRNDSMRYLENTFMIVIIGSKDFY